MSFGNTMNVTRVLYAHNCTLFFLLVFLNFGVKNIPKEEENERKKKLQLFFTIFDGIFDHHVARFFTSFAYEIFFFWLFVPYKLWLFCEEHATRKDYVRIDKGKQMQMQKKKK